MNEWIHWFRVDGRLIRDKNIYSVFKLSRCFLQESLRFASLRLGGGVLPYKGLINEDVRPARVCFSGFLS